MKNVPKIRFKEFQGEWEEKKLGTLGEFFKGNGISKADLSLNGQECILYGELYTTYKEVIDKVYSKTEIDLTGKVLSKSNDVIIPSSGETAIDIATASCVKKDNVLLGGDLNVFRPREIDGVFLSYQLNNSKRYKIAQLAQGASVVHIYNEQLKKLVIDLPAYHEQKRISDFLSKVDKLIEKQDEKVKNLELYKKGMMQKIFSQEIKFRGDKGEMYPEWKEIKLGDIGTFYRGHSYNSNDVSDKGLMVLRSNNIRNGVINYGELQFVKKKCKEDIVLRDKDIIICMANGSKKLVGKAAEYKRKTEVDKVTVGAFCSIYRSKNILAKYIFHIPKYKKYLNEIFAGTNINNLKNIDLEKLSFKIPVSKDEEIKINHFLSKIDTLIEMEKEKLENFKSWKKGLLQGMFV